MTIRRPRQNRVTPQGELQATHHHCELLGKRGDLHNGPCSKGKGQTIDHLFYLTRAFINIDHYRTLVGHKEKGSANSRC